MDTDLVLVLGMLLAVLTIPSLLAAWTEGRAPRVGAIMIIVAIGMVVAAVTTRPGGYAFNDVPDAIMSVVSRYILK
jgi:formate-dependent nitrite reductase membrane component NrfD